MKRDMLLNIVASAVATFALQLICYPVIAAIFGVQEYGAILVMMGVVNLVATLFANSLNNNRLVDTRFREPGSDVEELESQYQGLLLCAMGLSIAIVMLSSWWVRASAPVALLTALACVLMMFETYHAVSFRIIINYRRILAMNCLKAAGYCFGLFLAYLTELWPFVFLSGEALGSLYVWLRGQTAKARPTLGSKLKETLKEYSLLVSASLAANLGQYADRFLIYPILGDTAVGTFTIASYLGKTSGIVFSPVSGVLLTYYSKGKEYKGPRFVHQMGLVAAALLLIYVAVVALSRPLLSVFYPDVVDMAVPYVPVASAAAILSVFAGFIQPFILAYGPRVWQTIIQGSFIVSYVVLAILLSPGFGLIGFCWATVAANIIRLTVLCVMTKMIL